MQIKCSKKGYDPRDKKSKKVKKKPYLKISSRLTKELQQRRLNRNWIHLLINSNHALSDTNFQLGINCTIASLFTQKYENIVKLQILTGCIKPI